MIKRPTVFVLSAGASCPYGFPTGEGLVDEVVTLTRQFFNRFIHSRYINGRVGDESDGALEVLGKLQVIA
jgi:hypothetical protein